MPRRGSARSRAPVGRACRRSCRRLGSTPRPSTRPPSPSGWLRGSTQPGDWGGPDLALELLLTEDRAEARSLAAQLEELNRERQGVEERILRDAIARVESLPAAVRDRRGYVLWDESWHEGVIGIVASRLVERFHRPVVLIARSGDGWKGSGRSIADFDLHAGLAACAEHLGRYGGHRAAAGLSIETEQLEAFSEAFGRHADTELADVDLRPLTTVDAIVPASALTLELAQELDRLAPFGLGNPEPTLLVACIEATGATTVGEGKHLRFRVRQQGRDGGSAIAFGLGAQVDRLQGAARFDVAFRLKENRWNGTVAPQLVVRRVFDAPDAYDELRTWLAEQWRAGEAAWTPEAKSDLRRARARRRRRRQLLESARASVQLLEHGPVSSCRRPRRLLRARRSTAVIARRSGRRTALAGRQDVAEVVGDVSVASRRRA